MKTPESPTAHAVAPLQIAMLLYPYMTLLDLAGPQAALGMHGKTHLVAETLDAILTDTGVSVLPTTIYADCPKDLDVLFVPGGFGTNNAMQDKAALAFLAENGKSARFVTSVCTGSVILAAAGLLDGYKATTHWALYPQLAAAGDVEVIHERVVADRNRFTGGGVTAGIDFGLSLLATLRGEQVACMTQLMMEYDPQPPFNSGSPSAAGPELTGMAKGMIQSEIDAGLEIAAKSFETRKRNSASV